MRRFIASLATALIAVALFAPTARAQEKNKDDLNVAVTFGWQGKMPSERWAPITLAISPGESPLSGIVTAEYTQGTAGAAHISAPFAATPNATTPVHLIVWLPDDCAGVRLSLTDDAGRVRWSQSFDSLNSTFSQPLPPLISSVTPLMVLIGRSTLFESTRDWPSIVASVKMAGQTPGSVGTSDSAWSYITAGRADPTILPTSWTAYDGVTVMVVTPDSAEPPDARGVEAIHTWVASGGRLVIRADAPGDAWRTWVPESLTAGLTIDSARTAPIPPQAKQAIENVGARFRAIREIPDSAIGIAGLQAAIPTASDTVLIRPITVPTDGWTVHWTDSAQAGLVVEGRYGFGAVILLGFDPGKTTTVASTVGSGAVWRAAIQPVVSDVLDELTRSYIDRTRNWGSGYLPSQTAINTGLERIAGVPGVGTAVFILIVACIIMLALLVGPLDYFILRRLHSLQRSWLTALAWVAVASAAAYAGPRFVRTESTRINRLSIEDCIAPPTTGDPTPETLAGLTSPIAFRSGLTGLYAGESGIASFGNADRASWWRGAAVRYVNETPINGSGIILIIQQAAGGTSGSQRGGPLLDLPMALWTFRTFADDSTPPPTLRAKVRSTRGTGWSVLVSGLPETARITKAALRIDKRWVTLARESRLRKDANGNSIAEPDTSTPSALGAVTGGVWAGVFPDRLAEPAAPAAWGEVDSYSYYQDETSLDERPGVITRLPGPSRRGTGIDRLLSTGKWAAIYLEVKDWPLDTPVQWVHKGEHTRILRVVTPLQED